MGNTYETVCNVVQGRGCELLYINEQCIHAKSLIHIKGRCGHDYDVRYDLFRYQNNGIFCKDCVKEIAKKQQSKHNTKEVEYAGYIIVKALFTPHFEVAKMVEGTEADFAVRPICHHGEWLPIQLKVSVEPKTYRSKQYWFHVEKKYDIVLVLVCTSDKRIWAFQPGIVDGKRIVQIGNKHSKYSLYEINEDNVKDKVMTMYNECNKYILHELNIPTSPSQQLEYKYRLIREQTYPTIEFSYPEQEALAYDFLIHGKKIQEKVTTHVKENTYQNTFGRRLSRSRCRLYALGENDYYWFHIPDTKMFYFIPEIKLYEHGFLSSATDYTYKSLSIVFYPIIKSSQVKHVWFNEYLYDYDTLTEEMLLSIIRDGKEIKSQIQNDIGSHNQISGTLV